MTTFLILFVALILDRLIGDPDWLWRRITHPVVLFGSAIGWMDKTFNRRRHTDARRRLSGVLCIAVLLVASLIAGWVLHVVFRRLGLPGFIVEIGVVTVLLAQKSLADHVLRVADGLLRDGLAGGRKAVSMIVGRDPETLDEPGVCRASVESLAENFSDGVVAPALWYALLGLPGLFVYKMLNTADSMVGHKTRRHLQFGWASARLDDLANWPAARLSILLIAAGAFVRSGLASARNALRVGRRDHALHRSPNSGWPEAAMAGALDIQLAGPRVYAGETVEEPMLNAEGRTVASAIDIRQAVRIFYAACAVLAVVSGVLAVVTRLL